MENHTAKHFVLQLGSLASLYLSLSFLLVLLFGLINILYPDAADTIWEIENANGMVRVGFAMTIVFFPTYLILTRIVNKTRRKEPDGKYLGLTKWLIYLSLLVGGAVLLGDLVSVIIKYLEGEVTERFLMKAFSVLVVVGAAFNYYMLDARGHWLKKEKKSIEYGIVTSIAVVILLVTGILSIDSPTKFREYRLDQTQISDLQNIQWQIQDYLAINNELPTDLETIATIKLPTAPEDRQPYEYHLTENGFELCAEFAGESRPEDMMYARTVMPVGQTGYIINPDNWEHPEGEYCFERVVQLETKEGE
ncbi:MAG: hypothetical protein KC877_02055 [Candidatus Kaiserbacteria bacterium]|nr:hypothetical protein [Candidatus Kaiserbacteria bacterium]MCB9815990.1 hypothetical protein [Candidatus Nomurabacteria bacterium]